MVLMSRLRLALVLTVLAVMRPAAASDEAEYTVVERDGAFELRQYAPMLAAETLVTDTDFDDAGNVAFGRLFRYISGNNRGQTKIAMTSPVVQTANRPGDEEGEKIAMTTPVIQQAGKPGNPAGGYRVAFIVPATYTRDTVPEPLDPNVRIVATPARLMASLRFSGWMSEELHEKKELALRAELGTRKLTVAGEPITAQYDAPFIPGPFRRNEVLIPVSREQPPP
jgi:hypothetical protein